jgi:nuclear pore complex protein Nup205
VPTIGDAIEALNDVSASISVVLRQIADLSAEITSKDHIRVETIREVRLHVSSTGVSTNTISLKLISFPDVDFLEELDLSEKQNLLVRELVRIRSNKREQARSALGMLRIVLLQPSHAKAPLRKGLLEMLLLLLWRHLAYYWNPHSDRTAQAKLLSMSRLISSTTAMNADSLRAEAATRLNPALQRLDSLILVRFSPVTRYEVIFHLRFL